MKESINWEYLVETYGTTLKSTKDDELQDALDIIGNEGWEVIAVIQQANSNKVRVVAKRPLTTQERRRRSFPA